MTRNLNIIAIATLIAFSMSAQANSSDACYTDYSGSGLSAEEIKQLCKEERDGGKAGVPDTKGKDLIDLCYSSSKYCKQPE